MPRFTPKRYEQIFARMIARTVSRSDLSDVSDTSLWKHVLGAAARQDDEQYYQMSLLLQLFSIDTATGDDLDARAREIQPAVVSRILARSATNNGIVVSRNGTTGTVSIPIGTKVKTSDGVVFTTTTTGEINPASPTQISGHAVGRDSGLIAAIADSPGTAGNVAAGTLVRFETKPAGVDEVTNVVAGANGLDKETDDSFRRRLKDFVAGLARCTVQAIEAGIIGQVDPTTSATILFANAIEDQVNRGEVTLFIDDGTGQVEAIAAAAVNLSTVYTWNGTTTVTASSTAEVSVGSWIRQNADGQWFEIGSITPDVSVTILNPGSDTIPSGSTTSSIGVDVLTEGFSPTDEALGGETQLVLDVFPVKDDLPINLATDVQGNLVNGVDYTFNAANGQIILTNALVAGEQVIAGYTYFTGLIAYAQKVIDGDKEDREDFPGFRAAGVRVTVKAPQVLVQPVSAILTVAEGSTQETVIANAIQAIKDYVNTLNISGDVLRAELIRSIMNVDGVSNVNLSTPVADVVILDDQLARTQDANISVT